MLKSWPPSLLLPKVYSSLVLFLILDPIALVSVWYTVSMSMMPNTVSLYLHVIWQPDGQKSLYTSAALMVDLELGFFGELCTIRLRRQGRYCNALEALSFPRLNVDVHLAATPKSAQLGWSWNLDYDFHRNMCEIWGRDLVNLNLWEV